jgi:hypothetical protein
MKIQSDFKFRNYKIFRYSTRQKLLSGNVRLWEPFLCTFEAFYFYHVRKNTKQNERTLKTNPV